MRATVVVEVSLAALWPGPDSGVRGKYVNCLRFTVDEGLPSVCYLKEVTLRSLTRSMEGSLRIGRSFVPAVARRMWSCGPTLPPSRGPLSMSIIALRAGHWV